MVDTFKAVNWTSNEMIGEQKADQMNINADWLFKNTPRAIYTLPASGRDLRRVEGIKIASGRAIITKRNRDSATVEVRFGNFFTSSCEPNVTTGIVSVQPRIHCTVSGIGQTLPDSRGIYIHVNVAHDKPKKDIIADTMYVSFSAMGY